MRRDWETAQILRHYGKKATPAGAGMALKSGLKCCFLQPVENLVGPEALQTGQRLVDAFEFLDRKANNFLDRMKLAVIKLVDTLANRLPAGRQPHPHRTLV